MKKEALLYKKLEDKKVHCFLCAHGCSINDGAYGFCGVRKNENGVLYTLVYGEAIASHTDPVEKKPLYHFLPGTFTYSIATMGCNFRCGFCQNWQISQLTKKEPAKTASYELKPEEVVREAIKEKCASISYTYTEPTIFFEYAYDTAKLAKKKKLANIFVTNGYMTKEALIKIKPYLDACNVDLKAFKDETYRNFCSASLTPVLDSIRLIRELGIWLEITTLIVPGMNEDEEEVRDIAKFIKNIDPEIPWHLSRFHPDHKMQDREATDINFLRKAKTIAIKEGLKNVYVGNVPPGVL